MFLLIFYICLVNTEYSALTNCNEAKIPLGDQTSLKALDNVPYMLLLELHGLWYCGVINAAVVCLNDHVNRALQHNNNVQGNI